MGLATPGHEAPLLRLPQLSMRHHQINYNCFNGPFAVSPMLRSLQSRRAQRTWPTCGRSCEASQHDESVVEPISSLRPVERRAAKGSDEDQCI